MSIKDTFMGITPDGRDDAVMQITEFVAGYASAATRAAYRSDLSLWLAHCRGQATSFVPDARRSRPARACRAPS